MSKDIARAMGTCELFIRRTASLGTNRSRGGDSISSDCHSWIFLWREARHAKLDICWMETGERYSAPWRWMAIDVQGETRQTGKLADEQRRCAGNSPARAVEQQNGSMWR